MAERAKHEVVVDVDGIRRRVAKVVFAKDGSIFVMFAGSPVQNGILASVEITPDAAGLSTIRLDQVGYSSSHLAKYAHHPDGNTHFSQDGQIQTLVRTKAEPLDRKRGHLFSLELNGIEHFALLPDSRSAARVGEAAPRGCSRLVCIRLAIADSGSARAEFLRSSPHGIVTEAGEHRAGVFLAAPASYALSDFVLFLSLRPSSSYTAGEPPGFTFIGGFDGPPVEAGTSCTMLTATFPCRDFEDLRRRLPSVDLVA